jgi:hypothetical protein
LNIARGTLDYFDIVGAVSSDLVNVFAKNLAFVGLVISNSNDLVINEVVSNRLRLVIKYLSEKIEASAINLD